MLTFLSLHWSMASLSFRNNPSPLHGASNRMMSKYSSSLEKSVGSFCVTMQFAFPHFTMFCWRALFRLEVTSLLTNRLSSFIKERRWVDLPPGAAHISSTRTALFFGLICFHACSINIELASC